MASNQHGGSRPGNPNGKRGGSREGAGRRPTYYDLRLDYADGVLLEAAAEAHGLELDDFLRRIAASYAADKAGTQAALAPLVAVEAWDGKEIL